MYSPSPPDSPPPSAPSSPAAERTITAPPVAHSLQRKQNIALGHITDNAGRLTASVKPRFDLGKTIFKTLPQGGAAALFQKTKLDVDYDWEPGLAAAIEAGYAAVPPVVSNNEAIFKFMLSECDFAIEHAEGSFLDHLYFCHDYTAVHYAKASPRVMLLHSICGVGTNCFPMHKEKLPTLRSLLSPEEVVHVEAFPSILRLLVHGPLLSQLRDSPTEDLQALACIRFHRLLDNEPLELSAEQLWEALNFQLIHAIDFLPPGSWQRTSGNVFFEIFVALHELLSRLGKLEANVGWDPAWMQPLAPGMQPADSWRHWLVDLLPTPLVLRLASKSIANYSAAVGHSLEYTLVSGAVKM